MIARLLRKQALILSMAVVGVAACTERDRSDGALTVACRPSSSATGQETRISHPSKPAECKFGVVMFCNACVYDSLGRLSHSVSDPCGVCLGTTF